MDLYFVNKFEAFTTFKSYIVLIVKEIDNSIKVLCKDCGGEYNSHEFVDFYENHGIKR